jgi:hypothetical protein
MRSAMPFHAISIPGGYGDFEDDFDAEGSDGSGVSEVDVDEAEEGEDEGL